MYFIVTAVIDIDTDDGVISYDIGTILRAADLEELREEEENIFIDCVVCFNHNVALALSEDIKSNVYADIKNNMDAA